MAINERLIDTEVAAAAAAVDTNNLMLDLDASDVDSYDGDGDVWYDIHDFEFKPTINVAQHFNTVTYPGNSSAKEITGVGFKPDLVWIKRRNASVSNYLNDSVRGTSGYLMTNETDAQTPSSSFTSFDLDGFTLASSVLANNSSGTYVAWCFKAGGAAVLNEEGSIDSQVSANVDLGFSIVSYTGSASATVGHGLGAPPELIITKQTASTGVWATYSKTIGINNLLEWNSGGGTQSVSGYWGTSNPTSTVFGLSANSAHYNANGAQIAYCFTSKRGVSKVGSYIGNGTADNKIDTGFEPAFVMLKSTAANTRWIIMDNVRDPSNPAYKVLSPSNAALEDTSQSYWLMDFESDGFRLKYGNSVESEFNLTNSTYIYYAVAKNTSETSLIADTNLELHLDAASFPEKGETGYSNTPTTWTDSTSNGYVATITGGEFDSELGNSINLTHDSSRIQVRQSGGGASSALTNVANFTVEMWVNMTSLSDYQMIWSNMLNSSGHRQCYGSITNTDLLEFTIYSSNNTNNYRQLRTGNVSSKIYGKWTHICWQLIGSAPSKIWIDGEEQAVTTISGSGRSMHTSATSDFQIASSNNSVSGGLDGGVGQVRMYHSVLTQDEIRQNYNFTKPSYPNYFHADITGASFVQASSPEVDHFNFDGSNDSVDLDRSIGSSVWTNNWTASTWIKFDTTTPANQCIFTSHDLMYNYLYTNNNTQLRYSNGSSCTFSTASNSIAANNWYHIVVTKSSTVGAVIYINGVSSGTSSNNGNSAASSGSGGKPALGIYNSNGTNYYPLDGKIASHEFFNTVFTGSEVEAQFNAEKSHYGL